MKKVIGIVIAVALVAVIVIQQRKIGGLQAQSATAKATASVRVVRVIACPRHVPERRRGEQCG